MTRSRLVLLGFCAAMLGAFAFSATSAMAAKEWLLAKLNGEKVELITFLPATVELKAETTGILHSKIIGKEVLFECSELKAINAKLLAGGNIGEKAGTVEKSFVKFSGCITKIGGVTTASCEPKNGTEKGVILTNPGHGTIVLHTVVLKNEKGEIIGEDKVELTQILPDTGETFATIFLGELCSIGEEVPVIGKAFLKDCKNAFLSHLLEHLVEAGPLTELWTISKTEEHKATILGSAFAFLGGEHKGLHFSGDPD